MKDSALYLRNIIDKADEAVGFCAGLTRDDFLKNDLVQSAVIMKLIVIGEEAGKLPDEVADVIDLPWRQIRGFRNMAVHEYFELDLDQVWVTIQEDLPDLLKKCRAYVDGNR